MRRGLSNADESRQASTTYLSILGLSLLLIHGEASAEIRGMDWLAPKFRYSMRLKGFGDGLKDVNSHISKFVVLRGSKDKETSPSDLEKYWGHGIVLYVAGGNLDGNAQLYFSPRLNVGRKPFTMPYKSDYDLAFDTALKLLDHASQQKPADLAKVCAARLELTRAPGRPKAKHARAGPICTPASLKRIRSP